MRLLSKISLIILSIAILTMGITSILVYTLTKNALEIAEQANLEELGLQTADKIDRLLFRYYVGIQNIGEEEAIERTLSGELDDISVIERRIKELPFLSGPWDELDIIDAHGKIVVSNSRHKMSVEQIFGNADIALAVKEALSGQVYYSDFIIYIPLF